MKKIAMTLRALSALLNYPDAEFRSHLGELQEALHDEAALRASRMTELDALIRRLQRSKGFDAETEYVEMFDRGRGTSLHLFEHVHGDSRDRGPAMVNLVKTYEDAGLLLTPDELPDHLTVLLEYASTQPVAQARAFVREFSHILQAILSALVRRESPYASVLAAMLDIAGEPAQAVKLPDEPDLDETWAEPLAFDGCSTKGQADPRQPQPIRIVGRARDAAQRVQGVIK